VARKATVSIPDDLPPPPPPAVARAEPAFDVGDARCPACSGRLVCV